MKEFGGGYMGALADIGFVEKMDALIEQQKKDLKAELAAWEAVIEKAAPSNS